MPSKTLQKGNLLADETSPYLRQHAYNPVDWLPWGEKALEKARKEDRPLILSIGYSACHWCHVMERESFENPEIARAMNRDFVCVKVDREERPDVDALYMDALLLMGLPGGWPLHVFLTPEAKPFYGGTYFPPRQWHSLLGQVAGAFREHRAELLKSAQGFAEALNLESTEKYGLAAGNIPDRVAVPAELPAESYREMAKGFDRRHGGLEGEPKFPMPAVYGFVLDFAAFSQEPEALEQLCLTLDKMAFGGLYDAVGGGFARYSTDGRWFAPHFEKMLYDNAQLTALYARAFAMTGRPLYRRVATETLAFVQRELAHAEGGFCSALDADSEGEEGKYYVWENAELRDLLPAEDLELFFEHYHIQAEGNWEKGRNILHAERAPEPELLARLGLSTEEAEQKLADCRQILATARQGRVRPGLDDKVLTAWNGLLLQAFCEVHAALGDPQELGMARRHAEFLRERCVHAEGRVYRLPRHAGQKTLPGYLEDYAALIQAFLSLYEACFEEDYLQEAKKILEYALTHFYDEKEGLFFFVDKSAPPLIARKKELFDNVIPSSNAVMATAAHRIGRLLGEGRYLKVAAGMLAKVLPLLPAQAANMAHWLAFCQIYGRESLEIVIVGKAFREYAQALRSRFIPHKVLVAAERPGKLPLFLGKKAEKDRTAVYVCRNQTCLLPVYTVEEALDQIFSEEKANVFGKSFAQTKKS